MDERRGPYRVSDDPALLDVDVIFTFLRDSYWAAGIPREVVEKSVRGSLCFGLYDGSAQVGFARCVTDRATYAYLADVFVLPAHRGQGLSKWLMECILAHPDLRGLRRWALVTKDAHGLYAQFGFAPPARPERYMEKLDPDVYALGQRLFASDDRSRGSPAADAGGAGGGRSRPPDEIDGSRGSPAADAGGAGGRRSWPPDRKDPSRC